MTPRLASPSVSSITFEKAVESSVFFASSAPRCYPACRSVAPCGIDRTQPIEDEPLRLRRGVGAIDNGGDLLVVADRGEVVRAVEELRGMHHGLPGHLDLGAGHRAGAVEHHADGGGGPGRAHLAGRLRGADQHVEVTHRGSAARHERAIGLDVHGAECDKEAWQLWSQVDV